MTILTISAVIIAIAAGIFAILFRGLRTARTQAPTPEWVQNLSPRQYKPMERLLAQRDFEFLQSFSGVSPAFSRRFRSDRRRIFRGYLHSLDRDFARVCAGLRAVVATADEDRSDLAVLVARQQFAFRMAMVRVEFRLLLHAAGLGPVDTRQLIACFDSLRLELRHLTAAPAGAAA
jgi:hypothetical protein